jgi:galactose mutarotase-like enzyme
MQRLGLVSKSIVISAAGKKVELHVSTDWTYRGLRAIVLSNGRLRVLILPEAGGKIWQITHVSSATDLLWNNPRIPPAAHAIHTRYDDVWSGGWDELFPVDEEATILGERYPDHGELWSGKWDAEPFSSQQEIGVVLRYHTPISGIEWEKRISLHRDTSLVHTNYRLTNHGGSDFPFLWKLHPAFAVSPKHRIDFPRMRVVREPGFPGTLEHAPLEFDWPMAGEVDLRRVPDSALRQLYFFYGTALEAGWCALTNTASKVSCGLSFDPAVFPSCWLFASYGGWRNYQVAVLEPCTGYPLNFDALLGAGRQRTLKPGEVFQTEVLLSVETGHNSITGITKNGKMIEGP